MKPQKHYTLELDKAGDELSVCYWAFDTLEASQSLLKQLKKACTAYDVTLTITDEKANKIESWKLGDEFNATTKIK